MTALHEVEKTFEDVSAFADHYWESVPKVARLVYRERGVVEAEDIASAIWEDVVRSFDKSYSGVGETEVMKRFRAVGRRYAAKEALDLLYFSGTVTFSPDMIRLALASGALPGDDEFGASDTRMDIRRAAQGLPPKQKEALRKRYLDGVDYKEMSRAEQENSRRAVENIAHALNRWHGQRPLRIDELLDGEEWDESGRVDRMTGRA